MQTTTESGTGRFITIEGGEGVGKSLFIRNLASGLQGLGFEVMSTREPGGTPVADRLREIFRNPPEGDPLFMESELFLVSAARAQHVGNRILPALKRGAWVLCDRFADSSRVYQSRIGGVARDFVERVIAASTFGCEPDLTFLLDCDVGIALARMGSRRTEAGDGQGPDRYDKAVRGFHERLRAGYLELASEFPRRIVTIDAAQSPDVVCAQALAAMKERFGELAQKKR